MSAWGVNRKVIEIPDDYPCSKKYYMGPYEDSPNNKDLNWKWRTNLEKRNRHASNPGYYNPDGHPWSASVFVDEKMAYAPAPSVFGGSDITVFSGSPSSESASMDSVSTSSSLQRARKRRSRKTKAMIRERLSHETATPAERRMKLGNSNAVAELLLHKHINGGPNSVVSSEADSCCTTCCSSVPTSRNPHPRPRPSSSSAYLKTGAGGGTVPNIKRAQLQQLRDTMEQRTADIREAASREMSDLQQRIGAEQRQRQAAELRLDQLENSMKILKLKQRVDAGSDSNSIRILGLDVSRSGSGRKGGLQRGRAVPKVKRGEGRRSNQQATM